MVRLSEALNPPENREFPEKRSGMRLSDAMRVSSYEIPQEGLVDKNFAENIAEGASKAFLSAPKIPGSIMVAFGDYFRSTEQKGIFGVKPVLDARPIAQRIYEVGEKMIKENEEFLNKKFPEQENFTFGDRFAQGMGSGAISLASAIGLGMIAGPGAAGVSFGAMAGVEGFNEARKKDKDIDESLKIGGMLGFTEGSLEFFGVNRFIKLRGGTVKKVIENGVNGMFTEFSQEFLQSGSSGAIKTATGLKEFEGVESVKKIVSEALFEGAIGAVLGGTAGVTVSLFQREAVQEGLEKAGLEEKKAEEVSDDLMREAIDEVVTEIENIDPPGKVKLNEEGAPVTSEEEALIDEQVKIEEAETKERYAENIRLKKENTITKKAIKTTGEAVESSFRGIDETIGTISTRAANISKEFRDKLRKFEFSSFQELKKHEAEVKNFREFFDRGKMGDDFDTFDLALKNRDIKTVEVLNEKYGMTESYKKVRNLLDELPKKAEEVGIKMGFIENYYPRSINDVPGFLAEIRKDENWNSINQAILSEQKRLGYELSEDDKARLITQMISGYGDNQIRVGSTRFAKQRKIEIVSAKYNQFYKEGNIAILEYIRSMNAMIEGRKFLGRESSETTNIRSKLKRAKGRLVEVEASKSSIVKKKRLGQLFGFLENLEKQIAIAPDLKTIKEISDKAESLADYINVVKVMKASSVKKSVINKLNERIEDLDNEIATRNTNLDKGIGAFVNNLIENQTIPQEKAEEVVNIIRARLSPKGIQNQGVVLLRDMAYFATLNDITNGITQLGDLFLSIYKNNLLNTLGAFSDVITGVGKVTREDIGIGDTISAEFDSLRNRDKANRFILKYSLIQPFDAIGKNTFLQAAWSKIQSQAKKESSELIDEINRVFGEEADSVLNDIKSGNLSYDVKYLLFSYLSDVQPISLSEVPENYLKAGNIRIAYMLKTFTLKAMDIARNDSYNLIREGKYKEGAENLFKLVVTFALMGATTGALKDFILGRAFDFEEEAIDGILQLLLFNRYIGFLGKKDGYIKAWLISQIPPVYKIPDDLFRDISQDKKIPKWKSIRNVPLVGEPYYWWFGGGKLKRKKSKRK